MVERCRHGQCSFCPVVTFGPLQSTEEDDNTVAESLGVRLCHLEPVAPKHLFPIDPAMYGSVAAISLEHEG